MNLGGFHGRALRRRSLAALLNGYPFDYLIPPVERRARIEFAFDALRVLLFESLVLLAGISVSLTILRSAALASRVLKSSESGVLRPSHPVDHDCKIVFVFVLDLCAGTAAGHGGDALSCFQNREALRVLVGHLWLPSSVLVAMPERSLVY